MLTEWSRRATVDDSHAPIKALDTSVVHHNMPEQQLKLPLRSYGKEIGRVQKTYE